MANTPCCAELPAYSPIPDATLRAELEPESGLSFAVINSHTAHPASRTNRRIHAITSKIGWPLNKAAHAVGAEGCWPMGVKSECAKVARILQSFTRLEYPVLHGRDSPIHRVGISKKSMITIPDAALANCAGLAVFNVARAGIIHGSVACGSGLVVARRSDWSWSPPSSFVVSTLGAGMMVGLDMYDCVCVLNTPAQVDAFTNPRLSLGGEASVALGPIGTGGSLDAAISRTARPVWTYVKSRGLWAGVQIEGTIIVSRADANAIFYNERGISAKKILRGKMAWPVHGKPLLEMLRAIDERRVVRQTGSTTTSNLLESYQLPTAAELEQPNDTILDEKEHLARSGY